MAGQTPSLMARAVGFLARREHSRPELARKLARHADDPLEVEAVLERLQQQGLLSEARFAASVMHRRAAGRGSALVLQELRQHGVSAAALEQAHEQMQATELERAQAAWQKRFGVAPADAKDQARQMRFLAARGFSTSIIRQVVPRHLG